MKKTFVIILLLCCWGVVVNAQEFKTSFANTNSDNNRLVVFINSGSLTIQGYDGNEVIIKAEGYEVPPEKANGLKPLYAAGQDNSGIGLVVDQSGNTLQITKANHREADYHIKVPRNTSVTASIEPRNDDLLIENIHGEVEVNAKSNDIVLKEIAGPVVVNNVSGDIEIIFSRLPQKKPSSISAVSGDVDITMPADSKAKLSMNSVSGEIYTDFDLQLNQDSKNGMKSIYRRNPIQGTINNGGSDFQINTVSGNVYLRKK